MQIRPRAVLVTLLIMAIFNANCPLVHGGEYSRRYSKLSHKPFLLGPTGIRAYGPHTLHRQTLEKRGHEIRSDFVVTSVDPGAPAEGVVRTDDVIIGANGKRFEEGGDPRVDLGYAIIDSEGADGKLRLTILRQGEEKEATVRITPIGKFSPTWPFDCPRTERMVSDACRYLAEEQMPDGLVPADEAYVGTVHAGLFWLGTGDPAYLENARRTCYWFIDHITDKEKEGKAVGWGSWFASYGCILLAEYYQMTGDSGVLPGLELAAKQIARGQMQSGSWGHGFFDGYHAGYGEMNNAGLACWMALILSKECGVKVDESALALARHYFGRFSIALCSAYGDHTWRLEGYVAANGHMGEMAVAHHLDGSKIAAGNFSLKVARGFDRVEDGHTGCYFSIVWSPIAASFAPAGGYRSAMDQFGWYYALSRTPRGGFLCQYGGDNLHRTGGEYTDVGPNMTTGGIGLALVAPRRHLRILGGTKSVFLQDLPAPLQKARKLHQANDWDGCLAAVDAFLAQKDLKPEFVQLANELKDKSRYVKTDVEGTLARLESMMNVQKNRKLELRAYEIKHMLGPLNSLLGEENSRLNAIVAELPDEDSDIYKRGKAYFEACMTLKSQANEPWWVYGRMARDATREIVPQRLPRPWEALADTNGAFRIFPVGKDADTPKGWLEAGFDDSAWSLTMPRGDTTKFAALLVRTSFSLESVDVGELRLVVKETLPGGTKVYLNGEEVLDAKSAIGETADLLQATTALLRPGKNVLSIHASGKMKAPKVSLEAQVMSVAESFVWTPVPGRDAAIRTLTATRLKPAPYYDPKTDPRTLEEVLADMDKTPVFVPELYYSLQRLKVLIPEDQRPANIGKLLQSPSWGARLAGAELMQEALALPRDYNRMKKDQRDKVDEARMVMVAAWKPLMEKVISLLEDPNILVRSRSADVVTSFGQPAGESLPKLVALISNAKDDDWWVRMPAWNAFWRMDSDKETQEKIVRAVLTDPSSPMRSRGFAKTISIKEEAARIEAMRTYKEELVACVFDTPLAMWTRHSRRTVAQKLMELGKDAIRPDLDRFFAPLSHPRGGALEGSTEILAWFGEETVDKLETLADGKDERTRLNALAVLARMASQEEAKDDLVARIAKRLEKASLSDDVALRNTAKKGLKDLAVAREKKRK